MIKTSGSEIRTSILMVLPPLVCPIGTDNQRFVRVKHVFLIIDVSMFNINRIPSIIETEFQQIPFATVIFLEKLRHPGQAIFISSPGLMQTTVVMDVRKTEGLSFAVKDNICSWIVFTRVQCRKEVKPCNFKRDTNSSLMPTCQAEVILCQSFTYDLYHDFLLKKGLRPSAF